jgi:hypothetical protein
LTTSYGLFDVSKRVLVNNHSDEFPFMDANSRILPTAEGVGLEIQEES